MIRERTVALIAIASAILKRYRAEKQERGLLDYDDLIDKTLAMLNRTAVGWVHYKLDRGIDHVLIDEAQDTSPKQWQIVERLVDEFASGRGVRDAMIRTIFAVGDEKQSIFSFGRAAPHEFDLRHRNFRRNFEGAGLKSGTPTSASIIRSARAARSCTRSTRCFATKRSTARSTRPRSVRRCTRHWVTLRPA